MKYSILGKTGLKVSQISFGGIPIQQMDKAGANRIIGKVLECGINFIDTARGYTVSESLIGDGLTGKRSKVFLATKSMARDRDGLCETKCPYNLPIRDMLESAKNIFE